MPLSSAPRMFNKPVLLFKWISVTKPYISVNIKEGVVCINSISYMMNIDVRLYLCSLNIEKITELAPYLSTRQSISVIGLKKHFVIIEVALLAWLWNILLPGYGIPCWRYRYQFTLKTKDVITFADNIRVCSFWCSRKFCSFISNVNKILYSQHSAQKTSHAYRKLAKNSLHKTPCIAPPNCTK